MELRKLLIGVMLVAVAVSGCTHNKSLLNDAGVDTQTNTANLLMLENDGTARAIGNGAGPSAVNEDEQGVYSIQNVPLGAVYFQLPNFMDPNGMPIKGHIISPEDVEIGSASFTFNPITRAFTFTVLDLKANKSNVIAEQAKAIEAALIALDSMVETEAAASIKKWETAGTFGSEALGLLKMFFGLKFPAAP